MCSRTSEEEKRSEKTLYITNKEQKSIESIALSPFRGHDELRDFFYSMVKYSSPIPHVQRSL